MFKKILSQFIYVLKLLIYHCKITLNSKYFYLGSIMINLFEAVRFYEIVDIFFYGFTYHKCHCIDLVFKNGWFIETLIMLDTFLIDGCLFYFSCWHLSSFNVWFPWKLEMLIVIPLCVFEWHLVLRLGLIVQFVLDSCFSLC